MSQASGAVQWHYMDAARQQHGPHAADQMEALVRNGTIGSASLVWSPGMPGWVPYAQSALAGQMPLGAAPFGIGASGFAGAVRTCFDKYATFQGRASRPELWWFVLFGLLAHLAAALGDGVLSFIGINIGLIGLVMALALMLPSIAVGVRRLHDTDRSAWWLLIVFVPVVGSVVLLVFYCLPGTPGNNRFG